MPDVVDGSGRDLFVNTTHHRMSINVPLHWMTTTNNQTTIQVDGKRLYRPPRRKYAVAVHQRLRQANRAVGSGSDSTNNPSPAAQFTIEEDWGKFSLVFLFKLEVTQWWNRRQQHRTVSLIHAKDGSINGGLDRNGKERNGRSIGRWMISTLRFIRSHPANDDPNVQ